MNAKGQLESLLRIQELALAIREAEALIESKPVRLEEIEARFRERNAEYVAVKDQFDEVQADQKNRTRELQTLEEQREKYQSSLMEVKNQREYAAMLKEIDTVKAAIAEHEEAILKDMEALERLKGELATHEEHIVAEREAVERQSKEVIGEADAAAVRLDGLRTEREGIESKLPVHVRAAVARLEPSRQGIFLAQAENGTCLSCYVRIRPQVFQEIKAATVLHTCDSCRRYLYYAPAFRTVSDAGNAPAPDQQAANGPTV